MFSPLEERLRIGFYSEFNCDPAGEGRKLSGLPSFLKDEGYPDNKHCD